MCLITMCNNKITKRLLSLSSDSAPMPVILCIGSDRLTGDCFGPLVGEMLISKYNVNAFVYGNLTTPVTALNLASSVDFIKARHPLSNIIAVDSSVGSHNEVGMFRVLNSGIYPGAGVGKNLPKVGDYSLTATVTNNNSSGGILGIKLGFVYTLAQLGAKALSDFIKIKSTDALTKLAT